MIKVTNILMATVCLLFGLSFSAMSQDEHDSVSVDTKVLIMKIDIGSLVNNYPAILMSIDYMPNPRWLYGVFAGPVLAPEIVIIDSSNKKNDSGFKVGAESKFYFYEAEKSTATKFYIGLMYEYLHASFRTNYILKVNNPTDFYYKNVDNAYDVNNHSLILKSGIVTSPSPRVFLEGGLGLGNFSKSISPEPSDMGFEVVKNADFLYEMDMSGWFYVLEFKAGWRINR